MANAVHHVNCGTMCPAGGRWLGDPHAGWGRGKMVAHCLLVETARDGLVVVDTGFGSRQVDGRDPIERMFKLLGAPTLDPSETVAARVRALGFSAKDVRHIVVTHLDFDHAGGIGDFPEATIHVHAREHAAAMTRGSWKERSRYVPALWAHGPKWQLYSEDGDTWRGLPAITKLRGVEADIGLLPMHGHSRGHSAVLVKAEDEWLVHAGDAYFHHHTLNGQPVPKGFVAFESMVQVNGPQRRASAAALRELHERYEDVRVFCSHDPSELPA